MTEHAAYEELPDVEDAPSRVMERFARADLQRIQEAGVRRKARDEVERVIERSRQFVSEVDALLLPDVSVTKLREVRQRYGERFGAVPPWVLCEPRDEQVRLMIVAMDDDEELGGALVTIDMDMGLSELPVPGNPLGAVEASQRRYAERFGSVPIWLLSCPAEEGRLLLEQALVQDTGLGGELTGIIADG
jgi:hypothetical protein